MSNGAQNRMNDKVKPVNHNGYEFRNNDQYVEAAHDDHEVLPFPPQLRGLDQAPRFSGKEPSGVPSCYITNAF